MYRRFVSRFANITKPLTKFTQKNQAFHWNSKVDTAFQALKEALFTPTIFAYSQTGEGFVVDTDASNVGICGVLSQI
jgi:hypothetical protein